MARDLVKCEFVAGAANPLRVTDMTSVLDRFRLTGKVAIVTGASRGLGAAMALALAEAGADGHIHFECRRN